MNSTLGCSIHSLSIFIHRKKGIIQIVSSALYDLPVPKNLNFWWNFGSILGVCLIRQILRGLLLVMHYTPHVDLAFDSICHIVRDVPNG